MVVYKRSIRYIIDDLRNFLKAILDLPEEDYDEIEIADPHLLREYEGDKLGIIDVKLHTKSRKIVHIEIQLRVMPELKERIIYYASKLITEQVGKGDSYDTIKKVISIIITEDTLIENAKNPNKYHHRFRMSDLEHKIELSDLMEIHTLELNKLPATDDGTQLYDWARFINAENSEELDMIADKNERLRPTIVKLRELSADEITRDLYERREKARRDMDSFMRGARQEGLNEGLKKAAKAMKSIDMPTDEIARLLEISVDEVERLL